MAETVRLTGHTVKKRDDQVTTTDVEPKETDRVTEKVVNWTPQLRAQFDRDAQALADSYEIDPATGRYRGTLGTLLGFDPDEYIRQQKKDQRTNELKAKWNQWGDIANALIDLGTLHGGGTVWQRKGNGEQADAEARAKAARDNIFKMQQTGATLTAQREKAYRDEEHKRVQDFLKDHEMTVTHSISNGGTRTTTKSGGTETTDKGWDQMPGSRGGAGGGGSHTKSMVIDKDNRHHEIGLTAQEYENVAGVLISHYCDILNEKEVVDGVTQSTRRAQEFRKLLQGRGILKKRNGGKWNASNFVKDEVMRNGLFWHLTDAEYELIKQKSGIDLRTVIDDESRAQTPGGDGTTSATGRRRNVTPGQGGAGSQGGSGNQGAVRRSGTR